MTGDARPTGIVLSPEGVKRFMPLYELTAHELHEKLKAREITAVELTQSMYDRIGTVEEQIKGYLTLTEDICA